MSLRDTRAHPCPLDYGNVVPMNESDRLLHDSVGVAPSASEHPRVSVTRRDSNLAVPEHNRFGDTGLGAREDAERNREGRAD